MLKVISVISAISFLVPSILLAAPRNITEFIQLLSGLVGALVPLVIALAVLAFFWGLSNFILNASNEQKRADGKRLMVWGIIALFVIVSVWGIIGVLNSTFFGGTPGFDRLP